MNLHWNIQKDTKADSGVSFWRKQTTDIYLSPMKKQNKMTYIVRGQDMTKDTDMTVGNPFVLIGTFSFSLVAGSLFQQLYTFVDTIIIGKKIGALGIAAVGGDRVADFYGERIGDWTGSGLFYLVRESLWRKE